MSAPPTKLSEEQKARMEESRRRAVEKRKLMGSVVESVPPKKVALSGSEKRKSCKTELYLSEKQRFSAKSNGYDEKVIGVFKSMKTGRYHFSTRIWTFDLIDYEELLKKLRAQTDSEISPLPPWVIQTFRASIKRDSSPDDIESRLDPHIFSSLMPFQRTGLLFGIARRGRILLADDMGLGKTIQSLAIANYYSSEWPLLIISPSSVKYQWKTAVTRWISSMNSSDVLIVSSGQDVIRREKVIVISYDLVSKKCVELVSKKFKVAIVDESHFLKNHKSARCQSVTKVLENANHTILLSGTPALSRPMELFSQVSIIDPSLFKYPADYGMRYCNGRKISFGKGGPSHYDFNGCSNMEELNLLLSERCMIRRLKTDVLQQLPRKQRQMIILDPSSVKAGTKYMEKQKSLMNSLAKSSSERRGALLEWFHSTASAKKKAVIEYIKDLLEAPKKFIVFAHHQVMLKGVQDILEKQKVAHIFIDGRTSSDSRKILVDKFQTNDDCQVAVLSITAANSGLTLTAAQLVVFAELFWNPGILTQAEDRVHRIGQTDSVTIQYLVAKGTADDELWPLIQKKLDILNQAGLSKDNFTDADTTSKEIHKEKTIQDYFSSSFKEEELFDDDDFAI